MTSRERGLWSLVGLWSAAEETAAPLPDGEACAAELRPPEPEGRRWGYQKHAIGSSVSFSAVNKMQTNYYRLVWSICH